jgi:hypothetical protein
MKLIISIIIPLILYLVFFGAWKLAAYVNSHPKLAKFLDWFLGWFFPTVLFISLVALIYMNL